MHKILFSFRDRKVRKSDVTIKTSQKTKSWPKNGQLFTIYVYFSIAFANPSLQAFRGLRGRDGDGVSKIPAGLLCASESLQARVGDILAFLSDIGYSAVRSSCSGYSKGVATLALLLLLKKIKCLQ